MSGAYPVLTPDVTSCIQMVIKTVVIVVYLSLTSYQCFCFQNHIKCLSDVLIRKRFYRLEVEIILGVTSPIFG